MYKFLEVMFEFILEDILLDYFRQKIIMRKQEEDKWRIIVFRL